MEKKGKKRKKKEERKLKFTLNKPSELNDHYS